MERITKPVFIILLLSISITASIFMIIESGSFFQGLYKADSSISFMGYWAAFLNEIFMGVMAAVWLPGKKDKQGEKIHPLNVLFKILLVFLFITTVCGSSLKTVFPLYGVVQQQENQKKVVQILQSQVKDNRQSLEAFVQQNQRVNAALSVRNQVKIKEELKNILINQKSIFGLWVEILIVLFIRFGVQLANLSCIWLAGWVYRQPLQKTPNKHTPKKNILEPFSTQHKPNLNPKDSPKYTQHKNSYTQKINNKNQLQVKIGKTISQKSMPASTIDGTSMQSENSRNSSINVKLAEVKTNRDDHEMIYDLRTKIARLLGSRNEGISLSDVGKAIGERESNLREIVNPKTSFRNGSTLALQNILAKIENLYDEEQARMF